MYKKTNTGIIGINSMSKLRVVELELMIQSTVPEAKTSRNI